MHHFVPDFDNDDDFVNSNPNSSSSLNLLPRRKSIMDEDDNLMELLWQNGQVIVHNQRLNNNNNNNTKKPSSSPPPSKLHQAPMNHHHHQPPSDQNLFIQEDEMSSWLHYPLRDDDFCSDLLFSSASPTAPPPPPVVTASVRPPVPSSNETRPPPPPVRNFMNFSRLRGDFTAGRGESVPLVSKAIVRESTQVSPSAATASSSSAAAAAAVVVDPGLTRRTDGTESRVATVNCGINSAVSVAGLNRKGKAVATTAPAIEIPGSSSSVASKSEIKPVGTQPETEKTNVDERKRKERESTDETECRSSEETNKQGRGSTSSMKRSRAAEVHNLSERKRRDRINERMKALQELIPRCNKSDKASMLDEAIDYMKSLQLQIQMMSMGCGMMPMMYTGMQQYMPHMAMGMGMNQPIPPPPPPAAFMPYPNLLAAQRPLPTQTHMGSASGPHNYPVHASDPSRVFVPNQQCDPTLSNQPHQYPGYMDPYHQFRGVHPIQPPQFQNQTTSYPTSSRVSSSKEPEEQGNHTTG